MEYNTLFQDFPAKSRARCRRPAAQDAPSQAVHRNLASYGALALMAMTFVIIPGVIPLHLDRLRLHWRLKLQSWLQFGRIRGLFHCDEQRWRFIPHFDVQISPHFGYVFFDAVKNVIEHYETATVSSSLCTRTEGAVGKDQNATSKCPPGQIIYCWGLLSWVMTMFQYIAQRWTWGKMHEIC